MSTDFHASPSYLAVVSELHALCREIDHNGGSINRLRKLMVLLTRGHFGEEANYALAYPALKGLRYDTDPAVSTLGIDLDHTPGVDAEHKDQGIFVGVRRATSHKLVVGDVAEIEPEVGDSGEPEQGTTVFVRNQRVEVLFTAVHSSHAVAWDLVESLMEFLLGVRETVSDIANLTQFDINEALPRRRNPDSPASSKHAISLNVGLAYDVRMSTQSRTHRLRQVMIQLQAAASHE